jgi:hypothetical protein
LFHAYIYQFEAGFLKDTEYGETTMTTFIDMTIKENVRMYKSPPSLTKEALEQLAKDPAEVSPLHFIAYGARIWIAHSRT